MVRNYRSGGFEVVEYDELASTNTLAEEIASSELKDKTVIFTRKQTRGRGQATNKWESAPNRNISMTVILCPEHLEAGKQFAVSMVIALGCLDFLKRYVGQVSVKWPNVVYAGDRKIAGILIEHRIAGPFVRNSLCGIGVNINQEKFLSDAPNPISLLQLTGREMLLDDALAGLLECIGSRYVQINDYKALEEDFLQYMYRADGVYWWEDEAGRFEASVAGIDEYGQLVLRDIQGRKRIYAFKEVKYC